MQIFPITQQLHMSCSVHPCPWTPLYGGKGRRLFRSSVPQLCAKLLPHISVALPKRPKGLHLHINQTTVQHSNKTNIHGHTYPPVHASLSFSPDAQNSCTHTLDRVFLWWNLQTVALKHTRDNWELSPPKGTMNNHKRWSVVETEKKLVHKQQEAAEKEWKQS